MKLKRIFLTLFIFSLLAPLAHAQTSTPTCKSLDGTYRNEMQRYTLQVTQNACDTKIEVLYKFDTGETRGLVMTADGVRRISDIQYSGPNQIVTYAIRNWDGANLDEYYEVFVNGYFQRAAHYVSYVDDYASLVTEDIIYHQRIVLPRVN